MRDLFFSMTPGFEPAKATRSKRTVYVLDHNMSQQQWCIYQYYFLQIYINFFMRIIFFSYDLWIQPTKTRLISGQSIY